MEPWSEVPSGTSWRTDQQWLRPRYSFEVWACQWWNPLRYIRVSAWMTPPSDLSLLGQQPLLAILPSPVFCLLHFNPSVFSLFSRPLHNLIGWACFSRMENPLVVGSSPASPVLFVFCFFLPYCLLLVIIASQFWIIMLFYYVLLLLVHFLVLVFEFPCPVLIYFSSFHLFPVVLLCCLIGCFWLFTPALC